VQDVDRVETVDPNVVVQPGGILVESMETEESGDRTHHDDRGAFT